MTDYPNGPCVDLSTFPEKWGCGDIGTLALPPLPACTVLPCISRAPAIPSPVPGGPLAQCEIGWFYPAPIFRDGVATRLPILGGSDPPGRLERGWLFRAYFTHFWAVDPPTLAAGRSKRSRYQQGATLDRRGETLLARSAP